MRPNLPPLRRALPVAAALVASLGTAVPAHAMCPVCAVAVGAGVGFSRWLGVDDAVAGVWAGAMLAAMVGWTDDWLDRRKVRFAGRTTVNAITWTLLTFVPLWYAGFIGHPDNALVALGVDKLLFGTVAGAVAFWWGASWYAGIKRRNGGRAWFPFQKVVWPVGAVALLSGLFALVVR